jgi:hypothetical protein
LIRKGLDKELIICHNIKKGVIFMKNWKKTKRERRRNKLKSKGYVTLKLELGRDNIKYLREQSIKSRISISNLLEIMLRDFVTDYNKSNIEEVID